MGLARMAAARDAVLLLGLPGRGKTTLAEQLAADVTTGRLAGSLYGKPADALIISYEDTINVTLVPRLIAAEADLNRVDFVTCRDTGKILDLTRHLEHIERRVEASGAKLLVVDPLVAGMPRVEVNSHRDQDVRSVLAPLAAVAEKHQLAVLATMHFSQVGRQRPAGRWRLDRVRRRREVDPRLRSRSQR